MGREIRAAGGPRRVGGVHGARHIGSRRPEGVRDAFRHRHGCPGRGADVGRRRYVYARQRRHGGRSVRGGIFGGGPCGRLRNRPIRLVSQHDNLALRRARAGLGQRHGQVLAAVRQRKARRCGRERRGACARRFGGVVVFRLGRDAARRRNLRQRRGLREKRRGRARDMGRLDANHARTRRHGGRSVRRPVREGGPCGRYGHRPIRLVSQHDNLALRRARARLERGDGRLLAAVRQRRILPGRRRLCGSRAGRYGDMGLRFGRRDAARFGLGRRRRGRRGESRRAASRCGQLLAGIHGGQCRDRHPRRVGRNRHAAGPGIVAGRFFPRRRESERAHRRRWKDIRGGGVCAVRERREDGRDAACHAACGADRFGRAHGVCAGHGHRAFVGRPSSGGRGDGRDGQGARHRMADREAARRDERLGR